MPAWRRQGYNQPLQALQDLYTKQQEWHEAGLRKLYDWIDLYAKENDNGPNWYKIWKGELKKGDSKTLDLSPSLIKPYLDELVKRGKLQRVTDDGKPRWVPAKPYWFPTGSRTMRGVFRDAMRIQMKNFRVHNPEPVIRSLITQQIAIDLRLLELLIDGRHKEETDEILRRTGFLRNAQLIRWSKFLQQDPKSKRVLRNLINELNKRVLSP